MYGLALMVIFVTCVGGESNASPGCEVQDDGKKLQCRGVGLTRIPKTILEGIEIA